MPKLTKGGYYAVKEGRTKGVFLTWDECEAQIKGYPGAKYKKFPSNEEAACFVAGETFASTSGAESSTTDLLNKGRKRALSVVEDESGWDVVYSDGACKGNGKSGSVAGVGVWWGPNDPRNIAERCPGDQTNNRAELIAILRILETTPFSKKPLLIKTDSQYSKNCIEKWLRAWVQNNFYNAKGEPVKNAGIIRYLAAQLDARAKSGQLIKLQYVKGHSGEKGNDGADAMANQGTLLPEAEEREWDKLAKALREKIERDTAGKNVEFAPVQLEVVGDSPDSRLVEIPLKTRKITELPQLTERAEREDYDASTAGRSTVENISRSQQDVIQSTGTSSVMPNKHSLSTGIGKPSTMIEVRKAAFSTGATSKDTERREMKDSMAAQSPPPPNRSSTLYSISQSRPALLSSLRSSVPETRKADTTRHKSSTLSKATESVSALNHPRVGTFPPMKVLCVMPPLIPVSKEDIDIGLYADCILDDGDLANELDG